MKDGTECLLIRENKDSKPHRINAKRFNWKVIDLSQMQRQVQECSVNLQQEELSNKFSVNELAHQVIMPIVIYNLAIVYTERLLRKLADNRIEQTRKLSRVMKDFNSASGEICLIKIRRMTQQILWTMLQILSYGSIQDHLQYFIIQ